eukprot:TRINITY_DN70601_c0_g1_i1.p1 TRINITY_DN70601_c0_g1~~TRINITY_DN70601_c0_g1_i1.p1  ORF type:complete len:1500 (-),score=382.22 TRINITY_DN70601_c0_g1_i1:366-4865(-)
MRSGSEAESQPAASHHQWLPKAAFSEHLTLPLGGPGGPVIQSPGLSSGFATARSGSALSSPFRSMGNITPTPPGRSSPPPRPALSTTTALDRHRGEAVGSLQPGLQTAGPLRMETSPQNPPMPLMMSSTLLQQLDILVESMEQESVQSVQDLQRLDDLPLAQRSKLISQHLTAFKASQEQLQELEEIVAAGRSWHSAAPLLGSSAGSSGTSAQVSNADLSAEHWSGLAASRSADRTLREVEAASFLKPPAHAARSSSRERDRSQVRAMELRLAEMEGELAAARVASGAPASSGFLQTDDLQAQLAAAERWAQELGEELNAAREDLQEALDGRDAQEKKKEKLRTRVVELEDELASVTRRSERRQRAQTEGLDKLQREMRQREADEERQATTRQDHIKDLEEKSTLLAKEVTRSKTLREDQINKIEELESEVERLARKDRVTKEEREEEAKLRTQQAERHASERALHLAQIQQLEESLVSSRSAEKQHLEAHSVQTSLLGALQQQVTGYNEQVSRLGQLEREVAEARLSTEAHVQDKAARQQELQTHASNAEKLELENALFRQQVAELQHNLRELENVHATHLSKNDQLREEVEGKARSVSKLEQDLAESRSGAEERMSSREAALHTKIGELTQALQNTQEQKEKHEQAVLAISQDQKLEKVVATSLQNRLREEQQKVTELQDELVRTQQQLYGMSPGKSKRTPMNMVEVDITSPRSASPSPQTNLRRAVAALTGEGARSPPNGGRRQHRIDSLAGNQPPRSPRSPKSPHSVGSTPLSSASRASSNEKLARLGSNGTEASRGGSQESQQSQGDRVRFAKALSESSPPRQQPTFPLRGLLSLPNPDRGSSMSSSASLSPRGGSPLIGSPRGAPLRQLSPSDSQQYQELQLQLQREQQRQQEMQQQQGPPAAAKGILPGFTMDVKLVSPRQLSIDVSVGSTATPFGQLCREAVEDAAVALRRAFVIHTREVKAQLAAAKTAAESGARGGHLRAAIRQCAEREGVREELQAAEEVLKPELEGLRQLLLEAQHEQTSGGQTLSAKERTDCVERLQRRISLCVHELRLLQSDPAVATLLVLPEELLEGMVCEPVLEDEEWPRGFTPMHWAAEQGRLDLLEHLLSRLGGLTMLEAYDERGRSSLFYAQASVPRLALVWWLREEYGPASPMHRPAMRPSTAHLPEKEAALLNRLEMYGWLSAKWVNGYTMLHWAAEKGHADLCEYLIQSLGAEPLARDDHGRSPLQTIADDPDGALPSRVREIIMSNSSLAGGSNSGSHTAASSPHPLADIPSRRFSMEDQPASRGSFDSAATSNAGRGSLSGGGSVQLQSYAGVGNIQPLEPLQPLPLELETLLNTSEGLKRIGGMPANYMDLMRQVEAYGWDGMEWSRGYTLLHWACRKNIPELCDHFIRRGADPRSRDDTGRDCFDYARENSSEEAFAVLEDLQPLPELTDDTPTSDAYDVISPDVVARPALRNDGKVFRLGEAHSGSASDGDDPSPVRARCHR